MPTIVGPSPPGADCAVVLLPGRGETHEDLIAAGFARAVAERGLAIQVIAADAHLGYYREGSIVDRLRSDVVAPLRAEGKRVWLAGISLGGLGTIIYAREHAGDLDGLIAIAPFLGKRGLVEEIVAAGGPAHWRPAPPPAENTVEALWVWIGRSYAGTPPVRTRLAYGTGDRLHDGQDLFAEQLDPENVLTVPGGHNNSVWTKLWSELLDRGLVCSPPES